MKILTVIPVRGGSKGIPGKNIKLLGGKPLLYWTTEAAMDAGCEIVYVNTEDAEIKNIAEKGGLMVFDRPAELAGDAAKSIDVILHMLESLEQNDASYDAVLLLQATYPFRKKNLIPDAIRKFEESGADSLVSVIRVPEHYNPHWCFEDKQGFLKIATGEDILIPRRQELPTAYVRDGAIYLTSVKILKERKGFMGEKTAFIESDPENYINLDGPEDWKKAVQMCERIQL